MSLSKQAEFFDKVDMSVSVAKLIYSYLEERYPCKLISEIAKTTSGGTPLRGHGDYYGGNIPWIKSGELNDGLITEYEETVTEEGLKNSSAKIYPKGTLVLALYGATAGKTGVVNFDTASNQAVAAIYPSQEVNNDFLFWFFRQKRFDYIQMSFGAAQPNISQAVVKNTKIAVPNKDVQKDIITFLNCLEKEKKIVWNESIQPIWNNIQSFFNIYTTRQKIIKELAHQQSNLQLLRQTLLQEAVQGKLTKQDPADEPAAELLKRIKKEKEKLVKEGKGKKEKELPPIGEDEIPFALPEGWVWCRLREVGEINPRNVFDDKEEVSFIPMTLISSEFGIIPRYEKRIWKEIKSSFTHFAENDVAVAKITPCFENSKAGIFKNLINGIGAGTTELHIFRGDVKNILPDYVYLFFKSPEFLKLGENKMTGSAGQKRVPSDYIKNCFFPLPPLPEQQRIVAKVQQLQHQTQELETQVQQSRAYAQQLLQSVLMEAFGGKSKVYEMKEQDEMSLVAEE